VAERSLTLDAAGLDDHRQLVNRGRPVTGLGDEARVLGVGDRLDGHEKSSTWTRWTGRSSSSASSEPMRNSPAGISASSGMRSDEGIRMPKRIAHRAFSTTLFPMKFDEIDAG
jgi:hypothetical protein